MTLTIGNWKINEIIKNKNYGKIYNKIQHS